MKMVKTITVEGSSDDDCNRQILESLAPLPVVENVGFQEYKLTKLQLVRFLKEAHKNLPSDSLFDVKKYVEDNIHRYV
jgi:hypothetical protein